MSAHPVLVLVTCSLLFGCQESPIPAPLAHRAEEPDAPKGETVADPVLRESRDQADAILADLISGKLENDADLSPVSRKVKGYQSCSIKSQKIVRDGTVNFRGVLTGPKSHSRFDMTMVKQVSGRWAIGAFSITNSE